MQGPESATDHYIVALRGRRALQVLKKFDVKKLKSEDIKDEFNAKLLTKISELQQTLILENEVIVARWKEHFEELLNLDVEIDDTVLENLNRVPIMHKLENEITMEELHQALK